MLPQDSEITSQKAKRIAKIIITCVFICKYAVIMLFSIFVVASAIKISKFKAEQDEYYMILKQYNTLVNQTQNELAKMKNQNESYFGGQDVDQYVMLNNKLNRLDSMVWGAKENYSAIETNSFLEQIQKYESQLQEMELVDNLLRNQVKEMQRVHRVKLIKDILSKKQHKDDKVIKAIKMLTQNIKTDYVDPVYKKSIKLTLISETQRLKELYFIHLAQELPICVVISTQNNARNHRYEYNLQSILNQQYKNYKIILIDNGSTDKTSIYAKLLLKRNKVSPEKYFIVRHNNPNSNTANVYYGIKEYCQKQDIVFLMKGQDQFVSKNTFKTISTFYRNSNSEIVFANRLNLYDTQKRSQIKPYLLPFWTINDIDQNKYRQTKLQNGYFVSFLFPLFNKIKQEDMRSSDGSWLNTNNNEVFIYPMLEMSCGRFQAINQFLYLEYNRKDKKVNSVEEDLNALLKKKPYECLPGYKIFK